MDELIAREFQSIRDLIAANEQRRADLAALEHEQRLHQAQQLDERLTRMNEFRAAMQDQQANFVHRAEFEDAKAQGVERFNVNRQYFDEKIENKVDALHERVEVAARPNWPFLSAIASVGFAAVAASWLVIGLKMESEVAPLALTVEQIRTIGTQNAERLRFLENATSSSTAADVESKTDRTQLNQRVRALEVESPSGKATAEAVANLKDSMIGNTDRINELRSKQTEQKAALVEIETQFCNADYVRNLMHANELRILSMLWAKSNAGERYPTDNAYYPRIGKCGAEGSGNSG